MATMRIEFVGSVEPTPMDLGDVWYDYQVQAWVKDGVYQSCAHQPLCGCFGKLHAGERAPVDHNRKWVEVD